MNEKKLIDEAILKRGLSKSECATILDLSTIVFEMIIRGHVSPHKKTAERISLLLNIDFEKIHQKIMKNKKSGRPSLILEDGEIELISWIRYNYKSADKILQFLQSQIS